MHKKKIPKKNRRLKYQQRKVINVQKISIYDIPDNFLCHFKKYKKKMKQIGEFALNYIRLKVQPLVLLIFRRPFKKSALKEFFPGGCISPTEGNYCLHICR